MAEITPFSVTATSIDGLVVARMKQATDDRGTVREFFRASAFAEAGVVADGPWVQLNITETLLGAVRGLHGEAMNKLVAVATGTAFGAYVDARAGSPTFGAIETVALEPGVQVFVPRGVCNGFQATSPDMQYVYCFDREWEPGMPGVAISPIAPDVAIDWPVPIDAGDRRMLSEKDRDAPTLADVADAPFHL